MSANMSANDSIWSPVNGNEQSYGSVSVSFDESNPDFQLEYKLPLEPDDDPLIPVPATEQELNGKFFI